MSTPTATESAETDKQSGFKPVCSSHGDLLEDRRPSWVDLDVATLLAEAHAEECAESVDVYTPDQWDVFKKATELAANRELPDDVEAETKPTFLDGVVDP